MIQIENAHVSTGIRIEYSLSGIENNETLVFVHGLGANLHQFELQAQFFAKDYRVLLVSLRGHGGSSAPPDPTQADYTVKKLSRDVQALLQHLEIKKVHFVGNSLGGLVGYELLELDSDLLGSLTTFGTTPMLHASRFIRVVALDSDPPVRSERYGVAGKQNQFKGYDCGRRAW